MSIINVKVKHIRPEYNNLEDWMKDTNNEYIGRGGVVFINKIRYPSKNSIWSNPYKIDINTSREEAIAKYDVYIRNKLKNNIELVEKLKKLKNKRLGCWCYPEACHGNVLMKIIDEYHFEYCILYVNF